jgi:hypothetical protein
MRADESSSGRPDPVSGSGPEGAQPPPPGVERGPVAPGPVEREAIPPPAAAWPDVERESVEPTAVERERPGGEAAARDSVELPSDPGGRDAERDVERDA